MPVDEGNHHLCGGSATSLPSPDSQQSPQWSVPETSPRSKRTWITQRRNSSGYSRGQVWSMTLLDIVLLLEVIFPPLEPH